MDFALSLLEKGLLPDSVIRMGIRKLLVKRRNDEDRGDVEENQKRKLEFVEELKSLPIAIATDESKKQHYEVPTEFYELVLGPRKKYSSCFYEKEMKDSELRAAEDLMLAKTCERAELANGMEVMDLGCGWGSLSLYIAEKYPDCTITAVSHSRTQKLYIDAQAVERGFKNLQVITCDVRVLDSEVLSNKKFDRVMSIEMFEHMKNYELLMSNISGWLKSNGKLFVHIFVHEKFAYHYEDKDASDWMSREFFTGGTMPSADLLAYFQKDLALQKQWHVNGLHYSKTLEAWLQRMDANLDRCKILFASCYGAANVTKWISYWRVFFMACSELFAFDGGNEWFVAHYLFSKKQ